LTQFQLSLWTALIVWAGFLDKAFLHTFFYRPICIGPLVGLLFGNLPMGLIAGVTIELMFLATVFVGTVTPPDEVTSAALATAFACISGNLWAGIAVAIPIGIAGQRLKQIRNNTAFEYTQKKLEEAAARASARGIVAWATVMPTLIEGLFFAVPSFLLLYFAAAPLQRAFDRLPYEVLLGIAIGSSLVGAVGIASFLGTIKNRSAWPYFIIGFVAMAYFGIGIVGVALIACAATALSLHSERKTQRSENSGLESTPADVTQNEPGEDSNSTAPQKKLTRRDLRKTFIYSLAIESGCSTSKQEAPGFTQAMIPVIESVYDTKEEKADAYTRHTQLFLTEGRVAQFIVGVVAKLEEQRAATRDVEAEDILLYKSALAGPLAGIGDSLLHGTLRPLMAGIACVLVYAGGFQNLLGPVLFFLVMTGAVFAVRIVGFFKGYSEGMAAIERLQRSGIVERVTSHAAIASYMLAGAFIPALLHFSLPAIPWRGDYFYLQNTLDLLVPGLIPLLYTFWMYRLLYKKNQSPVVLVVATLLLGIAVAYIGTAL
jgi:mannose/fructose/N-acetylgalactosamine-specific phosphotransferase system component IID/mannose/fructose/N-acetylgalactosamine-specific phosphotransferase system component IIC